MFNYNKIFAFIKKDYQSNVSYRLSFFVSIVGIFFSVFMFYYLAKLFGPYTATHLKEYGGDYFAFVLIGMAFSNYLRVGLQSFSQAIRNEQMMGTLEAMLVTPTSLPTIIIASSLWNFIFASFRVIIYLALGSLFFSVKIGNANILASLIVLILTIIVFSSLGIFSACFVMIFKKGDPSEFVVTNLSMLLGGVFYPTTLLPNWLQKISCLLPITYSLRAFRLAILKGYNTIDLSGDIGILTLFAIILFPISILFFTYAVRKAKRDGTLTHY